MKIDKWDILIVIVTIMVFMFLYMTTSFWFALLFTIINYWCCYKVIIK